MPVFFGWWIRWSYVGLVSVEPGVLSTDIYLGFQRRLQFANSKILYVSSGPAAI